MLRGDRAERGNLGLRCERRSRKWKNHEGESTEAETRGGTTRSSKEVPDKGIERRGCVMEPKFNEPTSDGRSPMNEAKPFCISKKEVWEGYKRVKENEGAAGVDEQTIEDFEKRLKKNL